MIKGVLLSSVCLLSLSTKAAASLVVLGPGGPAPAMKKCGALFADAKKVNVEVKAGPMDSWQTDIPNADIFYSGSENMMDSFKDKISELDGSTIQTHYLRPSAILVRPGNPLKIKGVKDLTERKIKVMVVNGAGQVGMWEDIVGRLQSAKALNTFRANTVFAAKNTGEADKRWKEDSSIEAWLVFNIWGTRNLDNAEIIPTEKELTIYRSMGTALSTKKGDKNLAKEFVKFVASDECRKVFNKEGWK
ncbi:substrate-binding domain-containing protein [Bdellovibrio sp. HCB185ZH]|uniref:substrate-binding domain-containing protein n=1 Tax=Bdellovibrio sp. HCB185ZH TaxID=3394235 RepID=UPI0039A515BF